MRHSTFALIGLAFLLLAPAARAETVVIKTKAPRKGMVVKTTDLLEFSMDLDIKADGQLLGTMKGHHIERSQRTEKVLLWTHAKQRISVEYVEVTSTENTTDPMGQTERKSQHEVLSGRSYIVEITEDEVTFESLDADFVTNEELAALKEDYEPMSSGGGDFNDLVVGKELVVGEEIEVPPETIAELMGADEEFEVGEFGMRLTETRRVGGKPCAIFAIDMVLSKREEGLRMVVRMAGEVVIRIKDGWLVSVSLEGPLAADGTLEDGEMSLSMVGGGTMKGTLNYRYNR